MDWIKIDSDVFYIKNRSIQLSLGSHASIIITMDINKYPSYEQYFFRKFNNHNKFDVNGKEFIATGTFIKAIDIDKYIINIFLRCDVLTSANILERRDEFIDDVLNNNF